MLAEFLLLKRVSEDEVITAVGVLFDLRRAAHDRDKVLQVFAFLFGLSMDYEVFILARMRESYDRTGDTRTAVIDGIVALLVFPNASILIGTFSLGSFAFFARWLIMKVFA